MKIVYFGLPLGALLLRADGHDVGLACLPRRDSPGMRRLSRAMGERALIVPKLDDPRVRRRIEDEQPRLLVSWFWTKRIPPEVLRIAPALGVHPSLLPRHRGPDPYYWAIRRGDAVTGVTAHMLDAEYDTGAVLGQTSLTIEPEWDAWMLAKKLDRPSLTLLREVCAAYADDRPPSARPQSAEGMTLAPAPTEDELTLDWHTTTAEVLLQIRAAAPWPGALTFFDETPIIVTRAAATTEFPRALHAGEAALQADHVVVRTRDGAVRLLAGRDEDENELDAVGVAALFRATIGR